MVNCLAETVQPEVTDNFAQNIFLIFLNIFSQIETKKLKLSPL